MLAARCLPRRRAASASRTALRVLHPDSETTGERPVTTHLRRTHLQRALALAHAPDLPLLHDAGPLGRSGPGRGRTLCGGCGQSHGLLALHDLEGQRQRLVQQGCRCRRRASPFRDLRCWWRGRLSRWRRPGRWRCCTADRLEIDRRRAGHRDHVGSRTRRFRVYARTLAPNRCPPPSRRALELPLGQRHQVRRARAVDGEAHRAIDVPVDAGAMPWFNSATYSVSLPIGI